MSRLSSRRILITGGSRGIGASVARLVVAHGARAVLLARDSESLAERAQELHADAVCADLADPDATTDAVERAAATLGGIDALVNNAGTFQLGPVANGSYSDWRNMVDVNILGLLSATRAAIPYLATSSNGQIINVSSLSGRRVPSSIHTVYSATKYAVHAISDGLRQELYRDGIRVTVISPGVVETNHGSHLTDPAARRSAETTQREWGLHPDAVAVQVLHVLCAQPDIYLTEIALMSINQPPI